MKVPLLDLDVIHKPLQAQILNAVEGVLKSQHFILGPEVTQLEAKLAQYCGVPYALGVSSGTDALLLALMTFDIKAGDEIITSPFTFFATAGAIARLGARPVFVDIDPTTFNLNPTKVTAAVTSKTRAIIPVHLFGQCAEMEPLLVLARAKKLAVIEDAAQAIGSAYRNGQRVGALGDVGCFSFFPSKNLGAAGDGGFVTARDEALYKKMLRLRVHGAEPKYYHSEVGGNFRLDAIQAAILNVKLGSLDGWTRQRNTNAQNYRNLFGAAGLGDKVRLPEITMTSPKEFAHVFNQFIVRVKQRDELLTYLKAKDIGTEIYYPVPLHLQECFKSLGYKMGDFPEAEKAALETLALPIFPGLTTAQQEFVVNTIRAFYEGRKG